MMVSIIIPTYNRAALLKEAVQSCLDQTYSVIEIIIVDDGSTDGTEMMVSQALHTVWKGRNIKYLKQANAGASAARNLGLQLAKGDYIQFLDSDDLLYPEKLKLQLHQLLADDADGCWCLGSMGRDPQNSETIGEDACSKLQLLHKLCSGKVHIMQTSAPLWRKPVLIKMRGWDENIAFGDDLEYHVRVLANIKKMTFVDHKLFFVREHDSVRLSDASNNLKQIESGIVTQQIVARTIKKNGLWDKEFQRGILKNARTLYANYLLLGNGIKIRNYERWMWYIARRPVLRIDTVGLIFFRKIFGTKNLIQMYKLLVKISK